MACSPHLLVTSQHLPSPSSNDTLNSLVISFGLGPCSRDEPLIDLSHYILSSLDACSMMVK